MKHSVLFSLAGSAAGLVNGIFGGGGGMVFLPTVSRFGSLSPRALYATCVAFIFPVCIVSTAVYALEGSLPFSQALPYLAGGLVGGFLGGKWYNKVPTRFLRWLFAGFLVYAGGKYLL